MKIRSSSGMPTSRNSRDISNNYSRPKKRKYFFSNLNIPKIFAFLASLSLVGIVVVSLGLMGLFAFFAKDLPSPDKLQDRTGSLSTRILDRNGKDLYNIFGDQNRSHASFEEIPQNIKNATLAVEDSDFYIHSGFDPMGIARSVISTLFRGQVQGGSTITQQLVKNTLLSSERSLSRKIKELVLSIQLEKKFTKDEILQMYLNEAPYGGTSWGVKAAAQSMFGKELKDLSLSESIYLSGLPQSPSTFLAYPERAESRRLAVIDLMENRGWHDPLIGSRVFLSHDEAEAARADKPILKNISDDLVAPHFVFYVKDYLTKKFGEEKVEQGGLSVTTTLDLDVQKQMQTIVKEEVDKAKDILVGNGALLALDSKTGEILAMVGSKDYNDKTTDGNVNVVLSTRQPGSTIKPLTYAQAFRKGYTPATMVFDAPTEFDGGKDLPAYIPVNYDGKYRGPVQLRYALGNSLNVPAVKVMKLVGLKESMTLMKSMGLTQFDPTEENMKNYGLSLSLGSGATTLMEMTGAYQIFANKGVKQDPVSVLKVVDRNGDILEEFKKPDGNRIIDEDIAFLISNILSDNGARSDVFGPASVLNIPGFSVAVKTGTTDNKRDNYTIGYTPSFTIGVWVGNNDNSPMHQSLASGVTGAAPIWNRAMKEILKGKSNEQFFKPESIVQAEVDKLSGLKPKEGSDNSRQEYFRKGTVPVKEDDMHIEVEVCDDDEDEEPDECEDKDEKSYILLYDHLPEWQEGVDNWIEKNKAEEEEYNPPDWVIEKYHPVKRES